jgi:RNA polymerase sigma factor (sigma-70 family)
VVLVELYDRWPRVRELFTPPDELAELPDRLRGFVATILRNDVISLLRRHRFRREHISFSNEEFGESEFDPVDYRGEGDDRYYDLLDVRFAFGELAEDEQEVIRLFFFEEMTVEQVAGRLQTSNTTAHRRRVLAVNKLRQRLGVPVEG